MLAFGCEVRRLHKGVLVIQGLDSWVGADPRRISPAAFEPDCTPGTDLSTAATSAAGRSMEPRPASKTTAQINNAAASPAGCQNCCWPRGVRGNAAERALLNESVGIRPASRITLAMERAGVWGTPEVSLIHGGGFCAACEDCKGPAAVVCCEAARTRIPAWLATKPKFSIADTARAG